jgi:hypothetical protein
MAKRTLCRLSLGAVLAFCSMPVLVSLADTPAKPVKTEYFKGKVVPLADLIEKEGGKLDADAAPYWLALVADDGKVYPLLKDDGARMFFKDAKLVNRPMRLTGRLLPGSGLLQVVAVHSYQKGELCDLYYWCDICSIKRYEKKMCDCCGGPMELREEPVKK